MAERKRDLAKTTIALPRSKWVQFALCAATSTYRAATAMMKIAVIGATGPTGIHLVNELPKTVASVRVIARSLDKLVQRFPEAVVEKWEADVRDAHATLLPVNRCDVIYDCIGLPGDQMQLHPVIARNIANALRSAKARCVGIKLLGLLPASANRNE